MGLLNLLQWHRKHAAPQPHAKPHRCRFEPLESRQLLAVTINPIEIGAVYFEDSNKQDESSTLNGTSTDVADLIEVSFTGGADGTQLASLTIELNNTFFDTTSASPGAYSDFPFTILSHAGFEITSATISDGGTQLVLTFSGFEAGEKLVFTVDVDEEGNLQPNAVAEGAEFEGATLTATFSADHTADVTSDAIIFYDAFDFADTGLEDLLPNNDYDNTAAEEYMPDQCSPGLVYTAGALGTVQQTWLPVSIAGTVYYDEDADNVQDSGESGIAGVTVTLYELVSGSYVSTATTTTDANGDYAFEGLDPGTYRVVETQPSGYLDVGATAGTVDGAPRGEVVTVNIIGAVALEGGEDSVGNDFAETLPVSISGHVYHDTDNDGVMDSGESGIGDATLTLYQLVDGSYVVAGTTTTADDGSYAFAGLTPGTYRIVETQPDGYIDGTDAAGTVNSITVGTAVNPGDKINGIALSGGESGVNYNFGELLAASISGYVYYDADDDGAMDSDEWGIGGATLSLYELVDGSYVDTGTTATTADDGSYVFADLTPGTYRVVETQPDGYIDGTDTAGTINSITVGAATNPGDKISAIVLASGQSGVNYNFGELLPASISGVVFLDNDNDGALDSTDTLLKGITVYLLDADGNRIASTTTSASGKYSFTDLDPGVYSVEEALTPKYLEGGAIAGSEGGTVDDYNYIYTVTLGSGVDATDYDFYEIQPATISGYVFQDGGTIVVESGESADVASLRTGTFTADDTPIAGVTLILCDASGKPLTNASGQKITTTTNADGYYEFTGLKPGVYSIVEVQPDGYVTGMDTSGSNGGTVVNRYVKVSEATLSSLDASVTTSGDAIVQIIVKAGDTATNYNFSEVLVKTETDPGPPPYNPPTPFDPIPSPSPIPGVESTTLSYPYYIAPTVVALPLTGGGGGPAGYSWHLSVIDGGYPRQEVVGDAFTQSTQNSYFDPVSWTGDNVDQGEWILVDENGAPIKKFRFGQAGATAVVGDWNGSGVFNIGVFIDGIWFLDRNGNGIWDAGDLWIKLGKKGDQPVSGDWNGDGKTDIGIFGPTWVGDMKAVTVEPGLPDSQNPPVKLRPKNVPPDPADAPVGWRTMKPGNIGKMRSDLIDHVFQYGEKGDRAITGDWNGDTIRNIGIFRGGTWFLDIDGDGRWSDGDQTAEFGRSGDIPIVGDWTGDGISKIGVYRDGTFYLDTNNNRKLDAQDKVIQLGHAGDQPVVGDWTGDGVDKVGVYESNAPAEVPLQAARP